MHGRWSKRTDSGLPIVKHFRFDDATIFTEENDHNPLVAAKCPECRGRGTWAEPNPEAGDHFNCGCQTCNLSGVIDEPARLFDNDNPPLTITADPEGRAKCPHCGWRFRITDKAVWTGWRHRCGQRLRVQKE
jgi:hypothetical protein